MPHPISGTEPCHIRYPVAPGLTAGVGGLKARAGGGDGGNDGGAGRYGRASRVCCDDGEVRSGETSSSTMSRLCHRMVIPMHCTSVVFPSAVGMSISLSS
jgi:hypothetical protein